MTAGEASGAAVKRVQAGLRQQGKHPEQQLNGYRQDCGSRGNITAQQSYGNRWSETDMTQDVRMERMRELVRILDEASRAYYLENREIMSNLEFDALYDELEKLEKETGIVLASSPTQKVGYESVSELPKETHEKPMLSLGKTKDREEMRTFIGSHRTLMSWKLDGLTVVLTYRNGELFKAVTRGNGTTGDVITPNARVFRNVPLRIKYQGELILRGEAVISYPDFEKINESLPEGEAVYKNPRNLCSGSVRQLSSEITARRNVRFYAFALVRADGVDFRNSRLEQFRFLQEQGFEVVEHKVTTADDLDEVFAYFEDRIRTFELPSDGLVALYDDIAYGDSLGSTAKTPRNALAFKWQDEQAVTHLKEIEWSPSRTGLINPVAIFEPVELEGTTVSRASVHNISILRSLKLGIGDEITVYKANMIIPQIAENRTGSGTVKIPDRCPACGGPTELHDSMGTQTLMCPNPDCPAKKIKAFTQFVSRDAMNIEGLSEMTLEKFIGRGFIHSFADLFRLKEHREEIVTMEGFGEQSADNLAENIEKSRNTTLQRVLFGLGIPNIGVANARVISLAFHEDMGLVRGASEEDLSGVEGVGPVMAKAFADWFADEKNSAAVDDLLREITIGKTAAADSSETGDAAASPVAGKTFVVTGAVYHYKSRRELQADIEKAGGKVTGSVSKKTDYLINNDAASSSKKNVTARELGIPILTEDEFLEMLHGGKESQDADSNSV